MNLASIVQRLPFHQRLNKSQSLILKIAPIWYDWCEQQRNAKGAKHFSAASDTNLTSFDQGTLTLACLNTSTATFLKHNRLELLTAFQKAGFNEVESIRIRMAINRVNNPNVGNINSQNSEELLIKQNNFSPLKRHRNKPSDSSIKSIEAVQSRSKNEHLANALQRLANTLKKQ